MKKLLLIIFAVLLFMDASWAQDAKYIEIIRPYKIYYDSNNPEAYVQFFSGEIYLGSRKTMNGRTINYGNLELVIPYNASNQIYQHVEKAEEEAIINRDSIFHSKLDIIITRQFISAKEQFYFDLSGIKKDDETFYLATNTDTRIIFQNTNSVTITDLDATFPHEWIRFIAAGMPTQFAEKEAVKNLEPVYDFGRDNYTEHIAANGQIYLMHKANSKVIATNEKYLSHQAVFDGEIELKNGQYLRVDRNGFGEIANEKAGSLSLNNFLPALLIIALLGTLVVAFFMLIHKKDKRAKYRMGKKSFWWQFFRKGGFPNQHHFGRGDEPESVLPEMEPEPFAKASKAPSQAEISQGKSEIHVSHKSIPPQMNNNTPGTLTALASAVDKNTHFLQKGLSHFAQKFNQIENQLLALQQSPKILGENKRLKDRMNEVVHVLEEKEREIKQLSVKYEQSESKYQNLSQSIDQINVSTDFVQEHLQMFLFLRDIESQIVGLLAEIKSSLKATSGALLLLMIFSKYKANKAQTELSRWQLILQGLSENGILTDKALLQHIKGESVEEEKANILHRQLHREFYHGFISTLLVLLEEMKNLEKLTKQFSANVDKKIIDKVRDFALDLDLNTLRSKLTQTLEIEIQYVALFDSYKNYPNVNVKSVNEPHHLLYEDMQLDRNTVQEIYSYGMKSPFIDEPTKVILAK